MMGLLLAGRSLWGVMAEPREAYLVQEITAAAAGFGTEKAGQDDPGRGVWAPIFGEPDSEPPALAPPARMPSKYTLKGLFTSGELRWAILSGDGDDQLVQEEDVLAGGVEVESIGSEGVWLRFEGLRELVAFSDAAPVRIASVELGLHEGGTEPRPRRQEVQTQRLTPTQLRDLILKSEADRLAKGLVPQKSGASQVEEGR